MKLMDDVRVPARLHRLSMRAAVFAFAATLTIALATGSASGAPRMTVLGAAAPATPSCPSGCEAIGKTTGFQTRIGKKNNPFVVPYPGRVVAWSIKLGAPSQSQMDFFKNFYGGEPEAQISVLKPVGKQSRQARGTPRAYKLKSQSPVEQLLPYMGTTTTFTLQAPLRVNTGQVVALTSSTWIPAFAINLSDDTIWRASRKKGNCTKPADIKAGRAHTTVGQERAYTCQYKTARLLYSATVVADPNAKPPAKN